MFCENCGTRLEAGEKFCPACGTKVPEENFVPQAASFGQPQMQPAFAGTAMGAAKTKGKVNIMMIITSVLMFISTLMPFVNFDRGFLGNIASGALGEYLPNLKYNLYQLNAFFKDYVYEYRYISLIIMIFVIITMIVALASGILNNKSMLIAAGVLSAVCIVLGIVYMYYSSKVVNTFNSELNDGLYSLGELGEIFGGAVKIKSINGAGLYLFMIAAIAQTFFSFYGASKK